MNIFERMDQVRKKIQGVKKTTEVSLGGNNSYKAVGHDYVLELLREHWIDAGILPLVISVEEDLTHFQYQETTQYGNNDPVTKEKFKHFTTVSIVLRYQNVEDPTDYVDCQSIGHGEDFGDKGAGKAQSYAVKMCHLKNFNLITGINDEERIIEDLVDPIMVEAEKFAWWIKDATLELIDPLWREHLSPAFKSEIFTKDTEISLTEQWKSKKNQLQGTTNNG